MENLLHKHQVIAVIIAILATLVFTKLLIPLAIRVKLVDIPGGRKTHAVATPLVGGIAMLLGFCIAILALNYSLHEYRAFLAASILLVFTGVLDDFHELTPRFRLCVQIVTGIMMVVWGDVNLQNLGNLLFIYNIHLNYFMGLVVSICAVIAIINAINMLDGVDGLVGLMVFIQLVMLTILAFLSHQASTVEILLLLIAVVITYLGFNFPFPWRKNAIVFMGDAGSMFLGFALVWFLVYLSQMPHQAANPAVFLWIMLVPLFDMASSIIRRLIQRRSPLSADREHIHHLLQHWGLSSLQIVIVIGCITLLFGIIGLVFNHLRFKAGLIFVPFLLLFVIYVIAMELIWRKIRNANTTPINRY